MPVTAPAAPGGLAARAATSVAWTVAQKWAIRVTGLLTLALLARLLSPTDFGVIAVALAVLPLIQVLADLGLSAYLVQSERVDRVALSTAFWFSTATGVLLAGVLVAAAPLVGALMGLPEVVPVLWGLAPAAFAVTVGSVPVALLRRELRFRAIAGQSVVASAAGQVIAVVLALTGAGVWALVAQTVLFHLVATTLAWITARWRPARAFDPRELARMLRFGVSVVGVELVTTIRIWAENAIIVAVLGAGGLGHLAIAQRLVQTAQDVTTSAVVPVSVTVFAQVRAEGDRLRSAYLRAAGMSYAVVTPVMVALAAAAAWAVPLLFGGQWTSSIVAASILAASGVFLLGPLDHGLLYGIGRPGLWLGYAVVIEAVALTVTAAVAGHGIAAIAVGCLAVAVAATVLRWPIVARVLHLPWWRIAAVPARVLAAGAVAAAVGFAVAPLVAGAVDVVALVVVGGAVVLTYLPLLRWWHRPAWDELVGHGRRLLRRRSRAGAAAGAPA